MALNTGKNQTSGWDNKNAPMFTMSAFLEPSLETISAFGDVLRMCYCKFTDFAQKSSMIHHY